MLEQAKCFSKKSSRKCYHHKNLHKMSAQQTRTIHNLFLCKLLLHDPFNTSGQVQEKGQACDFKRYEFSHSFIYFEVGHRQIFPGLESSSFPEARKS